MIKFWKRLSLTGKIFTAVATTSTIIVIVMAVLVGLNMRAGFARYLVQAEINRFDELEQALAATHKATAPGWPELTETPRKWRLFVKNNVRPGRGRKAFQSSGDDVSPPPARPRPRRDDPLRLAARISLLDANGDYLVGSKRRGPLFAQRPITAVGAPEGAAPIGWIGLSPPQGAAGPADSVFLRGQIRSLVLASIFALALSAVAAFFLARQFLVPVKSLAGGARALASGDYANRMKNDRYDELGDLIEHFNSLAENLEAAENSERQWITDTSHELQTPLAVLRAEIEALQDGVRQPTDSVLAGLHTSIMRLSHLVGDINTLSRTREGGFSLSPVSCDLRDIIDDAVEDAKPGFDASDLVFEVTCDEPLMLDCDRHRIRQLLDNLLENARRYTTGPGKVILVAKSEAASISICLEDTSPCPPESVIDRLFERFYRVEASRSREYGGSGLGLSICQAIANAHGGTITAQQSSLGGLKIIVQLPHTHRPHKKERAKNAG